MELRQELTGRYYGFKIKCSSGGGGGGRRKARGARGAACLHAVQAGAARAGGADRCGRGAGGARQSASGPRPRGRRQGAVRSVGVSPRAPGGGGEPRAARAAARCRSVSPRARPAPPAARRARRRARSLLTPPAPRPRLRPVFLWARQRDGLVQAVHCEDYDPRNRLRVVRVATGWRAIPRTAVYDAIAVPRPPQTARSAPPAPAPAPPAATARAEPTPLDSLLAVAERELRSQRSAPAADAHAALVESLSEAHYLPAPDEADDLLASLVARGLQDQQVEAAEELAAAELAARLQQELAAEPRRSTAAQSLLHLHQLRQPEPAFLPADLPNDLPADLPADVPSELLCDMPSELSSDLTSEILCGMAEEMHCDLPPEMTCEMPSETPGEAAHKITGENPHEMSGEPSKAVSNEVPCELSCDMPGEISCDIPEELSCDISEELPCEMSGEINTEMMPNEMLCEMPSEISQELPKEEELPSYEPDILARLTESVNDLLNEGTDVEFKEKDTCENGDPEEVVAPKLEAIEPELNDLDYLKDQDDSPDAVELVPTDLRINQVEKKSSKRRSREMNPVEDKPVEKGDELPKDLSIPRRPGSPARSLPRTPSRDSDARTWPRPASRESDARTWPRPASRESDARTWPRPASRESDAMQSPQPSGIPALPASPDPCAKNKQTLFLESLLSSPSPKMYTSEVTITKQQCEPLNLGKHRKSASPTITSCTDEIKQMSKDYGEPQEKKVKRGSTEDLTGIDNYGEATSKKPDPQSSKDNTSTSALKQFQMLKTSRDFNIPDPLLVPKDKLNLIISAPAKEIPALLIQRPELRLPEVFSYPGVLQDPDILVISLSQLESILIENEAKKQEAEKSIENKSTPPKHTVTSATEAKEKDKISKPQPDPPTSPPKPIPSMDALAGDIDAATSAALNQMLWLPYLSQLEAMAACSQNMDFLKALNNSGYPPSNYSELSQMFPSPRMMNPAGFPMMSQMDYDSRMQFAMWQEAMNHANSASQRSRQASMDAQMKEMASKSTDVQNPYVHSTKSHQNKSHSAARTSPIVHNYNGNQRSMNHNPYLQGMYPGMNPTMRPNVPLPGLQIPYFNPNMMGSQRSPRTPQQKSPTSPYFPNNNYLQSLKPGEAGGHRGPQPAQESPRPRISVKSLQNLMEPAGSQRRTAAQRPVTPGAPRRRPDEPEVGSTTPLGEPVPPPPLLHDPASYHLWHPLFGNHKSYMSPWNWTTVTATGD